MTIDVTVVVPVYNTGKFIEPCIEGVLGQSLAADRYEVIFVDDGSTDGTPELLDRLSAEHPDLIKVVHQPNSGWPGKPRNVGTDMARGDYVFYSDHDDRLFPAALERMVAMARRTGADVLVPKMVGRNITVPLRVVRRNIDRAVIGQDPITSSLTPHKLFRRAFLVEKDLRWVEGRIRLEDEMFVMEAYLRADIISVLADYPCYVRHGREDGGNAAHLGWESAAHYFSFVERTIDIVETYSEPGPVRDAMLMREYRSKMLRKVAGPRSVEREEGIQRATFEEVRRLATQRFPADFPMRLPPVERATARAVLDDRMDLLAELATVGRRTQPDAVLTNLRWQEDCWQFEVEGRYRYTDGSPVVVTPVGDRWAFDPRLIPTALDIGTFTTEQILAGELDLTVRDKKHRVEWFVDAHVEPELVPVDDHPDGAHQVVFRGSARLDPTTLGGGSPLWPGRWRLSAKVRVYGIGGSAKLGPAKLSNAPLRQVAVFRNPAVVVALKLSRKVPLRLLVAPRVESAEIVARRIRGLDTDLAGRLRADAALTVASSAAPWPLKLVVIDARNRAIGRYRGEFAPGETRCTAAFTANKDNAMAAGVWRIGLRTRSRKLRLLGTVTVDARGTVSETTFEPGPIVKLRRREGRAGRQRSASFPGRVKRWIRRRGR